MSQRIQGFNKFGLTKYYNAAMINAASFKKAFTQRGAQFIKQHKLPVSKTESPVNQIDQVSIQSPAAAPSPPTFSQVLLAIGTATELAGIPALAALGQEVAQSLVTPEQEKEYSDSIARQYEGLPRQTDDRVGEAWTKVAEASNSKFQAPEVVDSFLIYAQSDALGMHIGTSALKQDLADNAVLEFTLAHEEAHRQHRDSAGSKGLETLYELCQDNDQLSTLAMKALREGRHQNEREADLFAAKVVKELGTDQEAVLGFLNSLEEDFQHPDGAERATLVASVFESE